MEKIDCICIQCEIENRKEIKKATKMIYIIGQEIPLCDEHYIQFREEDDILNSFYEE